MQNSIIYIPQRRDRTEFALIEVETAGVVMEPNAARPELNTRLGALVERVFEELAPAKAAQLATQADDGLLTLAELDRMAEDAGTPVAGALQIIFDKAAVEEILVRFAASDRFDSAINEKNALAELAALILEQVGLDGAAESPAALRQALGRHLIISDYLGDLSEAARPAVLAGYALPEQPSRREHKCSIFVRSGKRNCFAARRGRPEWFPA